MFPWYRFGFWVAVWLTVYYLLAHRWLGWDGGSLTAGAVLVFAYVYYRHTRIAAIRRHAHFVEPVVLIEVPPSEVERKALASEALDRWDDLHVVPEEPEVRDGLLDQPEPRRGLMRFSRP